MDLSAYKFKVKPDQSLIRQQKTRVLTRPCVDKSNALLLWNEQSPTSLQCHASIIFLCLPGILPAGFFHNLMCTDGSIPTSLFYFSCRISRKFTLTSVFYKQVSFKQGRTTRPCDVRSWASYFCAIALYWIINSKRWHFYSMSVVPVDSCDFPSTQQQGIRLK